MTLLTYEQDVVAALAHELRTALAPILVALEWMRRDPNADALRRGHAVVERQVRYQIALLDGLMELAQIMHDDSFPLARVPVEVTSLATGALEDVRPLADERAQTLTATTCDEPLVVLGDGLRLKQVVINLLTNAVKYTSRDGRIGLTVAREGDAAVICVRDSGIGIRADMLARVFEPFQQARSGRVSDRLPGIGIGLALARRIVELHHGTVEARSNGPGLGSEFIARLPCRLADSPP